jgi:hypothetical protein
VTSYLKTHSEFQNLDSLGVGREIWYPSLASSIKIAIKEPEFVRTVVDNDASRHVNRQPSQINAAYCVTFREFLVT